MDMSKANVRERFRNHPVFTEFHRGVNFGFMAKRGYYSQREVLDQPRRMAAAGVNFSTLNANICQESYFSRRVFLDFKFSSGEKELTDMVKAFHDHGVHPVLKPCLTPLDGTWMGSVRMPETCQIAGVSHNYTAEWFASYGDAICFYADFAERNNIMALMVGAECFGVEMWEDEWNSLIEKVRSIYSGPITYEFTPSSRKTNPLNWIHNLDFLSYSYYPPAQELPEGMPYRDAPVRSVADMTEFLYSRRQKIISIVDAFNNMPIAFTEIGVRSAHGCTTSPCDFLADTGYDGKEQADYMEAVFTTFSEIPQWLGLYWWKWDETQNRPQYHDDPRGDKGFTIQGKPAEKVLKKWFAKQWSISP